MNPKNIRPTKKPEEIIRDAIIRYLHVYGWFVKILHGNKFQSGMPDLFACHKTYGIRLVEVKDPKRQGDVFTPAQHSTFPQLVAHGAGVWVLTGATDDEYKKLFCDANYWHYLATVRSPGYRA